MSNPPSTLLIIEGLEFYAFHGVPEAERCVGHRYCVDVWLRLAHTEAAKSDRIEATVDYAAVAHTLLRVGTQQQFHLLEALAEALCEAVLAEFPLVESLTLKVRKLLPPFPCVASAVGVEITRSRS